VGDNIDDLFSPDGSAWTDAQVAEAPARLPRVGRDLYVPRLPMRWVSRAAVLPGKALAAGMALWFQSKTDGGDATVTLPARTRRRFGLDSRHTLHRALKSLQEAGLVRIDGRPGAHSRITILDVP
jgi:hypothetical protein